MLRESVLAGDAFTSSRCGLNVLLNQGVVGWMKVYRLLPKRRQPKNVPCGAPSILVDEVAGLIADIFFNRQEACRC